MKRARRLTSLVLLAAACGGPAGRAAHGADSSASPGSPHPPADSLVLTAPGGVEVWFTATRDARDSAGVPCTERVLEIRRRGERKPVPLLYTGAVPRLVNDSTIEARLWLRCRAGDTYRVNLRTGLPVKRP